MGGFLDRFRQDVVSSIWKGQPPAAVAPVLDDKIALGVLLWAVAQADEKFLPEESKVTQADTEYSEGLIDDMLNLTSAKKDDNSDK